MLTNWAGRIALAIVALAGLAAVWTVKHQYDEIDELRAHNVEACLSRQVTRANLRAVLVQMADTPALRASIAEALPSVEC